MNDLINESFSFRDGCQFFANDLFNDLLFFRMDMSFFFQKH